MPKGFWGDVVSAVMCLGFSVAATVSALQHNDWKTGATGLALASAANYWADKANGKADRALADLERQGR